MQLELEEEEEMSVSTIAKRFKRSVLIVVAAAVAIVTVPLTPANAASAIYVGFDSVEAKTDTLLPTSPAPCTSLPSTGSAVIRLDNTRLPGSYGNCAFISAHYTRGGVDLPLSQIYVDGNNAVLVPQVSAAMQSNQNKVRLTIPTDELMKYKGTNNSPIRLHYADTSSFRRISLSLKAGATGTGDNAQPDINMDGTQLTGARSLFLFKDTTTGKFVRTVTVDVPRMQDIVWQQTGGNGTVSFTQTNDLSSTERTVRTYDITYVPQSDTDYSEASAVVYGDAFKRTWVKAHADSTSEADTASVGLNGPGDDINPYQCGYGSCSASFPDKVQEPFFYKVTSTTAGDMNSPLYERTGIPARAVNYADAKATFDDIKIGNVNWPNRLLDPSVTLPSPLSSKNISDTTKLSHIVDAQHIADSDWPLFNQFTDQGLYQGSELQQVNDGSQSYGQQIGYSNSGKDQSMAFYVQYNGLTSKATATNQNTWSYFLDKLDVNGQFFDIPYPKIPEKGLNVVPQHNDLFTDTNGKPTTSGQSVPAGLAYIAARESILGGGIEHNSVLSPDSLPDSEVDANPVRNYLVCPIGGNGSGLIPAGQTAYGDTFKPVTLYQKTIDEGINAGITVKVELINARTQGDGLADGFSRWDIHGGRTANRLKYHHLAPSFGPATQMTNLTPCYTAADRQVGIGGQSPDRTVAQWNQWKTLYRVTVTGMVNKKLDVNFHYGYTSQPTIWKGTSYPAQNFWIKDQSNWVDFSNSNGSIALNHFWDDPIEGNVKFRLKDGYINPQLTTYSGRTSRAVCGTQENTKCTPINSGKVNADGTFSYNVQLTSSQTEKITAPNNNSWSTVMTNTAQPVSLAADLVTTPLVVMATSTGDLPASEADVPEQYGNNGELTGIPVDGQANYYLKVNGNIPAAQNGQSFTGYKLYGILNDGKNTRVPLMEGSRLYPGDAVSTADAGIKLSNDTFTAARYTQLQLVPTFDATSAGVARLYNAAKFLKKNGNLSWQGNDFNFFAAPGLTATLVNYTPANTLTVDSKDYPYSAADSTLSAVVPMPSDTGTAADDDVLKFVYLAPTDAQVNIHVDYTWHDADNNNQLYSTQGEHVIFDRPAQYIPVTVTLKKSDGTTIQVTKAPYSSQKGNYFDQDIDGFTSGDAVSLSYSYEIKNKLMCIVNYGEISKDASSSGIEIPATPASRLYATNAEGTPQSFDTTLYDGVNKFTLNIDSSCHQGVIVYPMGNIPDKYTSTNSDGRYLLPDSDSMWKQYPMEDTDGSYRFDGKYPDGEPKEWSAFHREVEHPTLVTPYQNLEPDPNNVTTYDASNPMVYNVIALTTGNHDTPVGMRRYTALEPGYWKFSTDTRPLWKWRMHCPYFAQPVDENGKPIGSSVQPGKTTVCFLDAATSEVTILGDMPDYLKKAWTFTLQSEDGNNQDVTSGGTVNVADTRNYYPGVLQVASTNTGKVASSKPKFYMYTGSDATQASLDDTSNWVELVKGEEVETWPSYKKYADDIHPDVLYRVTGDHRVEESSVDYSPVPVSVYETEHMALKVVVDPITNSTLPSAGGMGTTWKIVGIITLIAAAFLAIVALLKKRATM